MKICSITLCNFRNFRGEQTIDTRLPTRKKRRNIILIGGLNGAGKTTIVESIRLCLFGRSYGSSLPSRRDYHNYLLSAKNKRSTQNADGRFFVQIEIEMDDTYPAYSMTLRREWHVKNGRISSEDFTVCRDGKPLEIVPSDYWEDYVTSLAPPYVCDYFFFDGERVRELASGNREDEILRQSIRDLIGLRLYETLAIDLEALSRRIKRRNIGGSQLEAEIAASEDELSAIDKNIARIEGDMDGKFREVARLHDLKKTLEKGLRRKAGAFARTRKQNERRLLQLKKELEDLNNEVRQICGEVVPFVIAWDVCRDVLGQIEKEKRLRELLAGSHLLEGVKTKFMKRLVSNSTLRGLSEEQLDAIRVEIKHIIAEMLKGIDNESQEFLTHDLTSSEMDFITSFISGVEEFRKGRVNEILKEREERALRIRKLRDKLRQVPEGDFVEEYVEELASVATKIELVHKDIGGMKSERNSLREKRVKVEELVRELEDRAVCIDEDARKIDLSMKTRDSIREFLDVAVSSKIRELERAITNMYRKLANKDDMVKEVKIDQQALTSALVDFDKRVVDKNSISAGEKEIYALSVLWGLSKMSNRTLPMIIDSPLAKLDKSHVENITESFFPSAGDQVIILSHNREIDRDLYKTLEPYISKAYTLSLGEVDKVSEGYFFD